MHILNYVDVGDKVKIFRKRKQHEKKGSEITAKIFIQ